MEVNPLDKAWGARRPAQPQARVSPQPLDHAGEASAAKRTRVGADLQVLGAEAAVLTAPSSIAWLFNLRGGDVIRSPLPLGQAILRADGSARLFLDPAKVSPELPAWLGNQVTLERPEALEPALRELAGAKVLVDPAQSSAWYFDTLEATGAEVVRAPDPCALPRACKNAVEVEGARRAHLRDGAALARFLHWLATDAQASLPDEVEVVTRLEAFREATGALKDLSFDTIAGAGPNGAVVHYRPTHRTNRRVEPGQLLLVDSGAQYQDGTTDITRTVAIGEPSAEQRDRFTRVLKGYIALARIRFPAGTTGSALDVLARQSLWMAGLDYDHGTGHGVGSYLGVHEGPQRIAKAANPTALQPGMILSNEPGYYRTGAYGIRIENLQVVTPAEPIPGGERAMLGFETLTFAPHRPAAGGHSAAGARRTRLAGRLPRPGADQDRPAGGGRGARLAGDRLRAALGFSVLPARGRLLGRRGRLRRGFEGQQCRGVAGREVADLLQHRQVGEAALRRRPGRPQHLAQGVAARGDLVHARAHDMLAEDGGRRLTEGAGAHVLSEVGDAAVRHHHVHHHLAAAQARDLLHTGLGRRQPPCVGHVGGEFQDAGAVELIDHVRFHASVSSPKPASTRACMASQKPRHAAFSALRGPLRTSRDANRPSNSVPLAKMQPVSLKGSISM